MTFSHTVSRRLLSLVASFALAGLASTSMGCAAAPDSNGDSDESAAKSAADRELARVGGGGGFALGSDGAYFVFDNGLYRVSPSKAEEKLGAAPDHAGRIAVTDRYVVVAASPLTADTLTFYDRTANFSERTVVLDGGTIEMLPTSRDRVIVSSFNQGLFAVGVSGRPKPLYTPAKFHAVRDLMPGRSPDVVYGIVDAENQEHDLIEVNARTATSRVVLHIQPGSFTYAYDPDTDTFFTERSHMSLPQHSIVATYDHDGKLLTSLETPLDTFGAVAVDADGFYLAARPGSGSWKIFAFDKDTLEMRDDGRVEPQVFQMTLRGKDVYYTHSKSSSTRLRVRPL